MSPRPEPVEGRGGTPGIFVQRPSDEPDSHHAFGLACVISASFFTSLAGILVRLVEEADGWQLQFYRYASFLVFILGALVWRHRGRSLQAFWDIGRPGLIAAVSLGVAFLALSLIHI